MELKEVLLKRRSVRKFTEESVSDDMIDELLHAAMSGPSACNRRPWAFYVVKSEEKLAKIKTASRFSKFDSPLAIVVCGNLSRALPMQLAEYWIQDCSAATENMLFYEGNAHKLSEVKFNIPGDEKDFMSPWTFTSDDGRFEMDFVPVLDRASCTDAKLIKSDQHQVFGLFTGKAVLDDGRVIEVKDFPGFAEKVENKW